MGNEQPEFVAGDEHGGDYFSSDDSSLDDLGVQGRPDRAHGSEEPQGFEGLRPRSAHISALAEEELRRRQIRLRHIPAELAADSVWGMLLYLFAVPKGGKGASTESLFRAAGVRKPTGSRWISVLCSHGLIERASENDSGAPFNLQLTPKGYSAIMAILSEYDASGHNP